MKHDEQNIDEVIRRAMPSAPRAQMESALDRVFARVQSNRRLRPSEPVTQVDAAPGFTRRNAWRPVLATAAAAALILAVVSFTPFVRNQSIAVLEAADGSVYRISDGSQVPVHVGDRMGANETFRSSGGAGAVLALADGSKVEMRSQSELSLNRADDGLAIRLDVGSIIVSGAKQPSGRLYVHTKDMTVAVTGTTSLVSTALEGSRVGVIEGEARLREENVEHRLRPGDQTATSPTLAIRPLKDDIAWSRNANALNAILANFELGMARTAGPLTKLRASQSVNAATPQHAGGAAPALQFEEASIRPCDPDNVPEPPAGARGGGANSLQMTPGRLHALCLTPATLIRTAYNYGPVDLDFLRGRAGRGMNFTAIYGLGVEDGRRIRGGPDWVRSEHYTIDAVADGAVDAETMRTTLLRALLESRFKLKAHVETEQIPAWTLTIASSGLRIKPVDDGACEAQPAIGRGQPAIIRPAQPGERQPAPPSTPGQPVTVLFRNFVDVRKGEKPTCGISTQRNGPNQVIVAGSITLDALGRNLASPLGGVVVTDKTGNTDKFNIVLEYVRDENTPGPRFLTPNQPEPASDVPRGQTIFLALEQQLGLKLEPAKAPREFVVIDAIERPSPN